MAFSKAYISQPIDLAASDSYTYTATSDFTYSGIIRFLDYVIPAPFIITITGELYCKSLVIDGEVVVEGILVVDSGLELRADGDVTVFKMPKTTSYLHTLDNIKGVDGFKVPNKSGYLNSFSTELNEPKKTNKYLNEVY